MDQEQLLIAIGVRQNQIEREMRKITQTVGANLDKVERRAKQTGTRMESSIGAASARIAGHLKGLGTAFVGGLAAGGIAGLVGQLGQVAAGVATIGNEAKRAGVSAKVFQEWSIVAEQARVPVDALIDGLKELSLRGDEFAITGKGPAAEAFGRLGYTAEELKRKLADPSALLLEIIDRLGKFDKAAQIRIADELFGGTGGERFVELLDQGAAGIRATIDEAHRLGNILSDDVITRAAEVDRQFKLVAQTVGTALKGAIVDAASSLQDFISAFNGFEAQRTAALDEKLAVLGRERLDVEREIADLRERQRNGQGAGDGIFGTGIGESTIGEALAVHERRMEALSAEEQLILSVLAARRKAAETPPAGGASTYTPPAYTPPAATGGREAGTSAIERQRQAVADLISELERELALVGATDLQREISNRLRQAGAAATDDERAKITALMTALHAEELAQQKATDAKREFANIAAGALSGFTQDLLNGATAGEAFGNMVRRLAGQLADLALQAMIIRPLMSIFGFSGGGLVSADPWAGLRLANGGYVSGPGTSTSDSIPARLSDGEFVVNAAATRRHRALLEAVNDNRVAAFAGGGAVGNAPAFASAIGAPVQNVQISAPITVNGSAGTPEQNADLAKQMGRQLEATLRGVVVDEFRRQTRPGNMAGRR